MDTDMGVCLLGDDAEAHPPQGGQDHDRFRVIEETDRIVHGSARDSEKGDHGDI